MYLYQDEENKLFSLSPGEGIKFLSTDVDKEQVMDKRPPLDGWLKICVTRVDASLWRIEFYDMEEKVTTIETWSARSVIKFLGNVG